MKPFRPAPDALICFLHIPKTAGTSLARLLENAYSESEIFQHTWQQRLETLDDDRRARLRVLRGHFTYGEHRALDPRNYWFFTFLREPVSRVISQFRYSATLAYSAIGYEHPLRRHLSRDRDGESMLLESKLRHFDNMAVRQLSGAGFDGKSPPFGQMTWDHYEAARAVIEQHFGFIGLQEQMAASIATLCSLLGIARPDEPPRVNVGKEKSKKYRFDSVERIQSLNQLDIALYDYVRERIELTPRSD